MTTGRINQGAVKTIHGARARISARTHVHALRVFTVRVRECESVCACVSCHLTYLTTHTHIHTTNINTDSRRQGRAR